MRYCRVSRHSFSIRYSTVKIQEIAQTGIEGSFSTQRLDSYILQNLHWNHLVMFLQLRTENKVLIFHIRVKKHELCQNTHNQTLTSFTVSFLCLSLLSSRHFHSFLSVCYFNLKNASLCNSVEIFLFSIIHLP